MTNKSGATAPKSTKHNRMETTNTNQKKDIDSDVKKKLSDVLMSITWREIARTYFGKSSSWLYHKLDGIDGNGSKGGFNAQEKEQLKAALIDLSERIQKAAKNL